MLLRTALLVSLLSPWSAIAFGATQPENARGFLERWLDAQNRGQFDAYQKLYADDFKGVRRSGPRSSTFDRNSGFSDYRSANVFGQPQFLEHGVVRALGDSYVDIEGPETPILICPC